MNDLLNVFDYERRAATGVVEAFNGAAMLHNDPPANGQTQTGAVLLGRDKWLEQTRQDLF